MGLGLQPAIGRATFRLNSLAVQLLPQRRHLLVLTYHRVGTPEELWPDPPELAECDTVQFEAEMEWLSRHCQVLDPAAAMQVLRGERRCPNRAVLITFDDGYRDDVLRVAPCLRRLGIRPLHFLATDFIGTRRRFWWDRVGLVFATTEVRRLELELDGVPRVFALETEQQRRHAADWASAHARSLHPPAQRDAFVERLDQLLEVGDSSLAPGPVVLDWDEVRQLRDVFDFGAHTRSHPVIARLDRQQAREELLGSKVRLEQELGQPCTAFAVPHGGEQDYSRETLELAAEVGFEVLFTLEQQILRPPRRVGQMLVVRRVALNSVAGLEGMVLKVTWPQLFVPNFRWHVDDILRRLPSRR